MNLPSPACADEAAPSRRRPGLRSPSPLLGRGEGRARGGRAGSRAQGAQKVRALLTPTLSPGEREKRLPRSGESQRGEKAACVGTSGDDGELFPLPEGEDGGEGQRREGRRFLSEFVSDVKASLDRLLKVFGSGNLFVEIQRHLRRGEDRVNRALIDLARAHKLPLLATNGVVHAIPEGRQMVDVFTC